MSNVQTNRAAKESVVNEIKDKLGRTKSIVLVNARGLNVQQDTLLRKTLRDAGGIDYKVYKNSMVSRSVAGTDFEGIREHLAGPTAVAFSYEDATKAAAEIAKHLKAMPKLVFKASCIDGTVYDAAQTLAIAEIPPREVLLSRLLGSLKSPMASFARLVQAIADEKPSMPDAPKAEAPVEAPAEPKAEAPAAEAVEAKAGEAVEVKAEEAVEVKAEAPPEPVAEVPVEAPVEAPAEPKAEAPAEPTEAPAEPKPKAKPRAKATAKPAATTDEAADAKPAAKPKAKPRAKAKPPADAAADAPAE